MPKEYMDEYQPLLIKEIKPRRPKVCMSRWFTKTSCRRGEMQFSVFDCMKICFELYVFCFLFFVFNLQLPNKSLLLAACAACIGGTFQYGYNISVINAPTMVRTALNLLLHSIHTSLSWLFTLCFFVLFSPVCSKFHEPNLEGALPDWCVSRVSHPSLVHDCVYVHLRRIHRSNDWWDVVCEVGEV